MRLNIGVIFGGRSVEHEISIISAVSAMANIDQNKYKIVPIYIDKNNDWYTGMHLKDIIHYRDIDLVKRYATKVSLIKKDKSFVLESHGFFKRNICVIDLVMPIGHGAFLEDGSLQGYLNMIGVPYTGPKVLGASIGQDKVIQKEILKQNNIPVCDYIWFYDSEYNSNKKKILESTKSLNYPLYVKPASLGSSIGISVVHKESELNNAIKEAFKFDNKIIIEGKVPNCKEVNISVLGNYEKQVVSEIEEINTNDEFYSFKEKYVENYSKSNTDKKKNKPLISKEMIEDMKDYAKKMFRLINASGVARVDFLIDEENRKVYINEINTIPGDLSSYLWMAKKMSTPELIDNLIDIAFKESKKDKELIKAFEGNLLERFDNLDGKKLKNKDNKND